VVVAVSAAAVVDAASADVAAVVAEVSGLTPIIRS